MHFPGGISCDSGGKWILATHRRPREAGRRQRRAGIRRIRAGWSRLRLTAEARLLDVRKSVCAAHARIFAVFPLVEKPMVFQRFKERRDVRPFAPVYGEIAGVGRGAWAGVNFDSGCPEIVTKVLKKITKTTKNNLRRRRPRGYNIQACVGTAMRKCRFSQG